MATIATEVCTQGNRWQRDRYAHMARLNKKAGIKEHGRSRNGTAYRHLLVEKDALHNFLNDEETLRAVKARFDHHKAGDRERVLTNTVASQPCCFNLFAPLWRDRQLTDDLFSKLLNEPLHVEHLEIEFTPNVWKGTPGFERLGDESLGDQSARAGTDADVAVFYTTETGKRGVVLTEFKYIEAEFSTCGSYHSKSKGPAIRAGCDAPDWYAQRVAPYTGGTPAKPDCGYLKYRNWSLLQQSKVLDAKAVRTQPGCPFKGSLNQLWRNLLLAEQVAKVRKLDAFHFWVLSPEQNTALWKERAGHVHERFQELLTPLGQQAYRRLELDRDVVKLLEGMDLQPEQQEWLGRFRARYLS